MAELSVIPPLTSRGSVEVPAVPRVLPAVPDAPTPLRNWRLWP